MVKKIIREKGIRRIHECLYKFDIIGKKSGYVPLIISFTFFFFLKGPLTISCGHYYYRTDNSQNSQRPFFFFSYHVYLMGIYFVQFKCKTLCIYKKGGSHFFFFFFFFASPHTSSNYTLLKIN